MWRMPPFMRKRLILLALVPGLSALAMQAVLMVLQRRGMGWRGAVALVVGYIVVIAAYVPLVGQWRRGVRRRLVRGGGRVCFRCGYSLLGLNDDGACPECGEAYVLWALRERWIASGLCTRAELAEQGPAPT